MKIVVLIFLMLFSFDALATETGFTGMFGAIEQFFDEIITFIFVTIPDTIDRFFAWVVSWLLYLKFYFMLQSLQFAHSVALNFLELININQVVNSAIASLPSDLRQVAADMRFFDALSLLVEALITRLVYSGGSN